MSELRFSNYALSEPILHAVELLGFDTPTDVQHAVIPHVLEGKDLIVRSKTGSGKTASFGIPICESVSWEENRPQALILTPTRELADQVRQDVKHIGRFKRLKVTAVYGKESFETQKIVLRQKCHIVVGTPGRVLDHLQKETLNVEQIKYLVIDEADELLKMGFIEQVEEIIGFLNIERCNLLFSATMPDKVKRLAQTVMKHPMEIQFTVEEQTPNPIEHSLYVVDSREKWKLLNDVITTEQPERAVIFCRTQINVDEVTAQLEAYQIQCQKIHGGMSQDARFAVMNAFKQGKFRYLIATDVAARGIDVEDLTHVIHYDWPSDQERYVHRCGRTGRAGKSGISIAFVTKKESSQIEEIERMMNITIERRVTPVYDDLRDVTIDIDPELTKRPTPIKDKTAKVNEDILKLFFNGGKKKKLRAVDFVGTIAKIEGVEASDIGVISIEEQLTYIDILNGKGKLVLQAMKTTTIKGKLLKVYPANEQN